MTPLQDFAVSVTEARKVFEAGRDMASWLVFYEAKQTAYAKLHAALPQVETIEDFWRYVQNMAPAAWLPIIEEEVHRKQLCRDCRAKEVSWPQKLCRACQKERRLATYQKAKERARVKQHMRKCPVCKVEPLHARRQRVCLSCQANARRERNRRYQKSLKERKLRRVQPDFTSEAMSTVTQNHISMQPQQTDSESVLLAGPVP
jgi:hypothetical protein